MDFQQTKVGAFIIIKQKASAKSQNDEKSASVAEFISLHITCSLKLEGSKVWMCVPATGGWAASSLGSEGAASWALAAASLETVSFGLDKGIGDGRKCLGNPLKNQAPDLFHT